MVGFLFLDSLTMSGGNRSAVGGDFCQTGEKDLLFVGVGGVFLFSLRGQPPATSDKLK